MGITNRPSHTLEGILAESEVRLDLYRGVRPEKTKLKFLWHDTSSI